MTADTFIDPDTYAATFTQLLELDDLLSPRSMQTDLGGSEIGGCREYARRRLAGVPQDNSPNKWPALVGKYLHEGILRRIAEHDPQVMADEPAGALRLVANLTVRVEGKPREVHVPLHPDWVDPDEPSTNDLKTKDGLALVRRLGLSQQERFQRHLQYLAAHQAGLVPPDGLVRNVVVDRSGREGVPVIEQEPFSMQVIAEAGEWIADVLYATDHGEMASRDKDVAFCERYCPFFFGCRGDLIPDGVVSDPRLTAAAIAYEAARRERKEAERLMDESRQELVGVAGTTPDGLSIRWVHFNGSEKQAPYERLIIKQAS